MLLAVTTIPGHALGLNAAWPTTDHTAHARLRNGHVHTVATSRAFICLTIASALTAFAMALAPWAGSAIAATVGSYPAMFAVLTAIAGAAALIALGTATINDAARS
ncbi:hypothetical protein [Jiangella endophytica]|uniref:hypothetical protein n=1 Tax=Jiangella endophytica TaxID=1623398 RepID=UPI0018E578DD|nr:hypothetical protein [Jiangella endophytica]